MQPSFLTICLMRMGYVCAGTLLRSQQAQIDLVGPPPPEPGWRAKAKEGVAASCFVLDWDAEQATCPQGQVSRSWTAGQNHEGRPSVSIRFDRATCAACPERTPCLGTAQGPRSLLVHERERYEVLHTARTRQQTEAFKVVYADRAGIEGSISQGVRVSDLRQSRSIGYLKTRLMHFLVAAALNFMRVAAWLAEVPQARTRTSAFARLAPVAT